MPDDKQKATQAFLEAWGPEFQKSVEMFVGLAVKIEPIEENAAGKAFDSGNSMLWQGQVFERDGVGTVWIGTPLETCTALTEGGADDDAGREALYRELLRQSFEGAAHILSTGRTPRLVCKEAIEDRSPTIADLGCVEPAWLVKPGGERSPILVALQPAFSALIREDQALAERPPEESRPAEDSKSSMRLDQMVDLELPISVVLGRAKLPIREVLKLTAGSLVELDRGVGDPVEIVIHNLVVARGEVVSIAGNYGVKIREVISRKDRVALHPSRAVSTRVSYQPTVN